MMERVAVAKSRTVDSNKTTICVTRYGNVMASRGSVIPLFVDQIKKQEPLTVTEPSMTRFLMSLDEAVDLVLFAFEKGQQGDLFVQKSPSASIGDLAESLIELFQSKSKIQVIGSRHAEKMYETLLTKEEAFVAKKIGNYFQVPADNRDLNYDKFFVQGQKSLSEAKEYNSLNTKKLSKLEIKEILLKNSFIQKALKE
jgi:UDP-glucose 4-epimerase